jgi:hypothetical protein
LEYNAPAGESFSIGLGGYSAGTEILNNPRPLSGDLIMMEKEINFLKIALSRIRIR